MSRVLIASSHFYPRTGGVERYVFELAKGLAERHGHVVTVLTTGPSRSRIQSDRVGEVKVVRVPTWASLSSAPLSPTWLWQLRRVILSERPDLINTHAPQPGLPDLVSLTTPPSIPLLATYHSGSLKKGGWTDTVIAGYETSVLPRVLRRSAAVVVTGPAVAEEPYIPEGKVEYIPPGVDTSVFRPDLDSIRRPGQLVYVGRMDRDSAWKGVSTLLRAMGILAATHPQARLQLVGDGDAVEDHRREAAQIGLDDRVEFTGRLDGSDLARAYQAASALVLASETAAESFGMVLIEAMACGTPVIGTRAGGIPGVIDDTGGGVLAPPRDPPALARAMARLLDDPVEASNLGRRGQEAVQHRYTWRRTADAYDRLVRDHLTTDRR